MDPRSYTKDELRALGFPPCLITKAAKWGDITIGRHQASGARIYKNTYCAFSLVRANVRDQASLDRFIRLTEKCIREIPALQGCLKAVAQENALEYAGVKYEFPEDIEGDPHTLYKQR